MSHTSDTKQSRKKELPAITLDDRLMILQQSIVDYQEAGGQVQVIDLHGNPGEEIAMQRVAIVLHGIRRDESGNLILAEAPG